MLNISNSQEYFVGSELLVGTLCLCKLLAIIQLHESVISLHSS